MVIVVPKLRMGGKFKPRIEPDKVERRLPGGIQDFPVGGQVGNAKAADRSGLLLAEQVTRSANPKVDFRKTEPVTARLDGPKPLSRITCKTGIYKKTG